MADATSVNSSLATLGPSGWGVRDFFGKTPAPSSRPGYRTVLFGDSMTDFNFLVVNPTASYDRTTGVLTLVESGGHFKWKGARINLWNRTYSATYAMKRYAVASVVNSTTYTVQLTPGGVNDLPSGSLAGITFAVTYQHRCSKSWLTWINTLAGQRFEIVHNGAQSGDTTVDALARLQSDCLSWAPQVVVMQAPGINDMTFDVSTGRNNVQRVMQNLKTIFDAITRSGAFLIVGLLTPVAAGEVRAQLRIMAAKDQVNHWIWRYSQQNPNVLVVDTHAAIVSPTDATGLARSGVLSATDFIHYSNVGGYRIARAALSSVTAAFPSVASTLPKSTVENAASMSLTTPTAVVAGGVMTVTSTTGFVQRGQEIFIKGATGAYTALNTRWVVDGASASNIFTVLTPGLPDGTVTGTLLIWSSRNLMPDPLMQAFNGTITAPITGTAATDAAFNLNVRSFSGTPTAVASIGPEPNGFGNEQRIAITAAVANDQPGVSFKNSIGTVDNRMYVGRTYYFEAQFRLASTNWANTPISEIGVRIDVGANSGETWRVTDLNQFEAVVPVLAEDQTLHIRTAPFTVPPDTVSIDSVQLNLWARAQGTFGVGTLTLGFSRFNFRDATPDEPGLADTNTSYLT